jgi:hypothetical protein
MNAPNSGEWEFHPKHESLGNHLGSLEGVGVNEFSLETPSNARQKSLRGNQKLPE